MATAFVAPTATEGLPVHRIRASSRWVSANLAELWEYKNLLYYLVWREVKVRYKQTAFGVAWAVIQPAMTMVVFSLFFGKLGGLQSDGLPYPIFSYSALIPWQLFAFALVESSNSVVANQRLITKVYFPRLIMPLAGVLIGLVDFVVSFALLVVLLFYYRIVPGPAIVLLPLFTLLAVTAAFAVGLWLSALNVRYRDVRYTLPFLTTLWQCATPVAYSARIIPPFWRPVYALNPMVGVVDGFRWAILGQAPPSLATIAVSTAATLVTLVSGLYYFRSTERTFADLV